MQFHFLKRRDDSICCFQVSNGAAARRNNIAVTLSANFQDGLFINACDNIDNFTQIWIVIEEVRANSRGFP